MGDLIESSDISEEDYRAIEEAVMETARGRWFLAEYAKRNRVSDTTRVVEAIDSLKSYITTEHDPCLLYTSPSPRDLSTSRMPSSA